jgi:hypothetical protein
MARRFLFYLSMFLILPLAGFARGGHSGHSHSSSRSHSSYRASYRSHSSTRSSGHHKTSGSHPKAGSHRSKARGQSAKGGPVHVRSYSRRSGTQVRTYDRSSSHPKTGGARTPATARARRDNVATCLSGPAAGACDHSLLTPGELARVHKVEAGTPAPSHTTGHGYVNSQGERVPSPTWTSDGRAPAGASAKCRDGSFSFSRSRRGTCSHHGGVASWL